MMSSAEKWTVMIICHYDESNSSGGLDKQARKLSRKLVQRGRRVLVLGSTRKLRNTGWSWDHGVRVRLFWTFNSPQLAGRHLPAALVWALQIFLWIVANRGRIAILHCHQIRIHAFVCALVRRIFSIPVILKSATGGTGADIKTVGTRKYFGPVGRKFIIKHTDCFVATTQSIVSDLDGFGVPRAKIATIPNGVDAPVEEAMNLNSGERYRRCLYLGRLAVDKNVVALIRAATAIPPEWRISLALFGKGPLLNEVLTTLSGTGTKTVSYGGWIDNPAVILKDYGYLILPSSGEGLSNAMLEAMRNGVVPVVSRVSGCVDHISHGQNGFFINGTDEASIAAAFSEIHASSIDDWQRMSANASAHAERSFDIDCVAQKYCELYCALEGRVISS